MAIEGVSDATHLPPRSTGGEQGTAESGRRVTYVTVVIVTWNTHQLTTESVRSVLSNAAGQVSEIIVVDNASTDGTAERLAEHFPAVRLLRNARNVGFAAANNQGAAASSSEVLLLLNSDARLLPGALPAMLEILEREPRAAIVGARLINADGSFQASHSRFPTLLREYLILSGVGRLILGRRYPSRGPETERGPQAVDYVEGACLLVRRKAYQDVGGPDSAYFMYSEEVDLCYAVRQEGWQVWYQPAAAVVHLGGASSRTAPNRARGGPVPQPGAVLPQALRPWSGRRPQADDLHPDVDEAGVARHPAGGHRWAARTHGHRLARADGRVYAKPGR